MSRNLLIRILCYVISAAALLTAAGYLARGQDKALGVFLVLIAAVVSRVLVLNIAIPLEHRHAAARAERLGDAGQRSAGDSAESTGESAR